MTEEKQRTAAALLLGVLGIGIIVVMGLSALGDGQVSGDDAGWVTAGFLSLREVMSKIENITLGIGADTKRAGE